MKKNYFVLLLVMITSASSFSQEKGNINLGILAGGTYTVPYGDDITKTREHIDANADKGSVSPNLNFRVGALIEYYITDKVSFNVGLHYTKRSWTEKFESSMGTRAYQTEHSLSLWDLKDYEAQFSFSYVDIPLLLRLKMNDRIFIHGGFVYSMKVDDNVSYSYTLSNGTSDKASDYIVDFFYEVKPNDRVFGVMAGINLHLGKGYNLDFSFHRTGKVLPERYDVGFNTMSLSLIKYFNLKKTK